MLSLIWNKIYPYFIWQIFHYIFSFYITIFEIYLNTTTKYLLLNIFAVIEITYLIFNVCFHVIVRILERIFSFFMRVVHNRWQLNYRIKKYWWIEIDICFDLNKNGKSYYYFISNYYYYYISILWYKEQWKSSTGNNKIEIKNRVQWKVSKLCIKDGSFEKN